MGSGSERVLSFWCFNAGVGFKQIKKCINMYKMHPAVRATPGARPPFPRVRRAVSVCARGVGLRSAAGGSRVWPLGTPPRRVFRTVHAPSAAFPASRTPAPSVRCTPGCRRPFRQRCVLHPYAAAAFSAHTTPWRCPLLQGRKWSAEERDSGGDAVQASISVGTEAPGNAQQGCATSWNLLWTRCTMRVGTGGGRGWRAGWRCWYFDSIYPVPPLSSFLPHDLAVSLRRHDSRT